MEVVEGGRAMEHRGEQEGRAGGVGEVERPETGRMEVVRRLTGGRTGLSPGGPADRADLQRAELIERETPVRAGVEDLIDAVEFGVTVRIVGFLPRLGPLKRDVMNRQDLTQPFPTDVNNTTLVIAEMINELTDRPTSERPAQCFGPLFGSLDNERFVISRDPAGTATRPLRVQRRHTQLVELMNHLPPPDPQTSPPTGRWPAPCCHPRYPTAQWWTRPTNVSLPWR